MFPSACNFIVLVFTVSLHVSAYMAIFKCVGYLLSYAWRIMFRCLLFLYWFEAKTNTIKLARCNLQYPLIKKGKLIHNCVLWLWNNSYLHWIYKSNTDDFNSSVKASSSSHVDNCLEADYPHVFLVSHFLSSQIWGLYLIIGDDLSSHILSNSSFTVLLIIRLYLFSHTEQVVEQTSKLKATHFFPLWVLNCIYF
jgi:hypothetical protein